VSAFFVNDACLTKCVTAILIYDGVHAAALAGVGRDEFTGSAIGRALRRMNADALTARYDDRWGPEELDYEFPGPSDSPPVHWLKALHCLSYQCAEGDIPETNPLWSELDRVGSLLKAGERINENSPEYERASWGD
jgi:hypothetical protein